MREGYTNLSIIEAVSQMLPGPHGLTGDLIAVCLAIIIFALRYYIS